MPLFAILLKFHFLSLWNWRTSYIGRFIEPVAYLLFLGTGLKAIVTDIPGGYPLFVLTGLVALLSFRSATNGMSDVANDRKWGVFAIYSMQGGKPSGYLASIIIYNVILFFAQFLILLILAFILFGAESVPLPNALTIGALGCLLVIGWTACGVAVGAVVQNYATRDLLVTVTTLPVVLAAPLFYPIVENTSLLFFVSRVNPLTYQVEWMRSISMVSWIACIAWVALTAVLALALLARAEKVSTER